VSAHPRRLLRTFLTGLLAALPLLATVAVMVWGARLVYAWLGPYSLIGRGLVAIGFGGPGSEVVGYLIGMLIVATAIFGLGLLVQTRLRGALARGFNNVVQRIPVVRTVYDLAKKFVDLLAQRDSSQTRSMSPVWLHFGGPGQVAVLGLLSTPEPVLIHGAPCLAVLVPTAPVPVGGGLLWVPQDWVTPAEVGVDGLTSIYVSMGITASHYLGAQPAAPVSASPTAPTAPTAPPVGATSPGSPVRPASLPPAVP
jgi:uncharacterized membrane protein